MSPPKPHQRRSRDVDGGGQCGGAVRRRAVANRAAKYADHDRGALHGLTLWALAFLLAILIAGASVTGGVTALLGGEAEQVNASETFVGDLITPDSARNDEALVVPPDRTRRDRGCG